MDVLAKVLEAKQHNLAVVLVTVVATRGSTPRKAGARMLVYANGETLGTVGGGTVEHVVKEAANQVLRQGEPKLVQHALTHELAMCCGGEMTFFLEPFVPTPTLIVFGLGHVGRAVVQAAQTLGFALWGVDDLPENIATLPDAAQRVQSYEPSDFATLPFGPNTFVLIATREHSIDQALLEFCIEQNWAYLGVIGSPRKALLQQERLRARGYLSERIAQIRCPMGLDIGAQTPEEIAVSVMAELILLRRGKKFEERL